MAQQVKNLPAMQGTQVQSQGGEEPLEEEMATHSNILAWEIPRTEQPGGLQSIGLQRVGYNRASKHIGNDFRMLSISGLHYIICTSSVQSLGHIQLFETPWTAACQAALSVGFPRQEYWSGLPFPAPGDLPNPGIESASLSLLHWQVGSLPLRHQGSPIKECGPC